MALKYKKYMKKDSWMLALKIMARLSGWVAFPVIIGVFLGKWLDRTFNTEPWLFLGTIGFCFLISIYGLAINAVREFKKIEDEYKVPKNKDNQAGVNKTDWVDKYDKVDKYEEKNKYK